MPLTDKFLQNMIVIEAASSAARNLQNASYATDVLSKYDLLDEKADSTKVAFACQRWLARYARPIDLLFGFRNGLLHGIAVSDEDAGYALEASETITDGLKRSLSRELRE